MGLAIMILGLVLFIGTHLVTTRREQRAALIARFGETLVDARWTSKPPTVARRDNGNSI